MYYLNARYYDPEVCRFISPDDISYLDPETIGGTNLYAYCNNNPVMYVDPNGHDWWKFWEWDWGAIGRVALGALAVLGMVGLSVVSFGIAAPLGISVITGMAVGIGTGIYNGVAAGKDVWGIVGNALTGGIIGGALAFALGMGMLGGASFAGTATLGKGISALKTFGLAISVVSTANGMSYCMDRVYNNEQFFTGELFASAAYGLFSGLGLWGLGALMGIGDWGISSKLSFNDKIIQFATKAMVKTFFSASFKKIFDIMESEI